MFYRHTKHALLAMWPVFATGAFSCNAVTPCAEKALNDRATCVMSQSNANTRIFRTEAIPTDTHAFPYNHAASLVELPNGDLLTAWVAGTDEAADDTCIVASRRLAGTETWSSPFVLADTAESGDANPVLFVDDADRVWLFYVSLFGNTLCTGKVLAQTSLDNGTSWNDAQLTFETVCTMIRNKPIITPSGRWIMPAYFQGVYQSWMYGSDDHGQTWSPLSRLFTLPNNLQPAIVVLDENHLLAMMRPSNSAGFTWQGISDDDGETWTMTRRHEIPNPGSGLDMIRLKSGEIVLAYNHSKTQRTPLSIAHSNDNGNTWSRPKSIQEGDGKFAYPCIIQTRDDMIHVVFSYNLQHIQHVEFNRDWLKGDA